MTAVPGAAAVQTPEIERLAQSLSGRCDEFRAAEPFPHVVVDEFLPPEAARAMLAEFPATSAPEWQHFHHVNEKKLVCTDLDAMGPATRSVIAALQGDAFVAALERLTSTPGLVPDPEMDGGGLQQTRAGGFLNVHTDFLSHTKRRTWSRQLNLLLFLNPDWQPSHHGWLEFWDADVTRCVRRIEPRFNRCVIFRTGRTSFHGVPAGVACPPGDARKALALYYFREEGRPCRLEPTYYVPLPGESLTRRALIRVDRWLIHGYSALKRYTPLGDRLATRILRRF